MPPVTRAVVAPFSTPHLGNIPHSFGYRVGTWQRAGPLILMVQLQELTFAWSITNDPVPREPGQVPEDLTHIFLFIANYLNLFWGAKKEKTFALDLLKFSDGKERLNVQVTNGAVSSSVCLGPGT